MSWILNIDFLQAASASGIPGFDDHPAHGVSINEFLTKLATGGDQQVEKRAVPAPVIHAPVAVAPASPPVYTSSAPVYPPPAEQEHTW